MAFTRHDLGTEEDLNNKRKRAQSLLASYAAIVAEVDELLADPDDLRPAHGAVVQQRARARGLPMTFTRFNRPAAEQLREDLSRMAEVAHRNIVAASLR